jgi:hypothetical protein
MSFQITYLRKNKEDQKMNKKLRILISGLRQTEGFPFLACEGDEDFVRRDARRSILRWISPEGVSRAASHKTNHRQHSHTTG